MASGDSNSEDHQDFDVKDPTLIAREYQTKLCQKALSENTIAYLGTGCGKTHIAVLLIHEMRHLIKKPQNNICVFLAPSVALVEQQAKVIKDSIDVKVGIYCGSSKHLKRHTYWEKELAQHEVLVMTPPVLLQNLSHCFIRIELIALLIFDECHHAQPESNHPYAEIMKVFYNTSATKLPRVFGMTASPILGKGASIRGLESLLHAKVYSVEDKEELERFVTPPKVSVYYYDTAADGPSSPLVYSSKLQAIKSQCVSTLVENISDMDSLISSKKMLQKLHTNLCLCVEKLGVWGACQAAQILSKGDCLVQNELMEMEVQNSHVSICNSYLSQAAMIFLSDCKKDRTKEKLNSPEVLEEPFFSKKLLQLINILTNFRSQQNMKCIIFVDRIVTAISLSSILQSLQFLSAWKSDFLVGVNSGLKRVSRKSTNALLAKFQSGEINLLVATKVGEEGLDIQTCCLVVRFDLPETVASFIQSRGRARMPQSEYAFLVDSGNEKEQNLIDSFTEAEDKMNEEIEFRTSTATFCDIEEKTYRVELTGATISSGSSISLLYRYCSKLPHDEFFKPKLEFSYFDEADGTVCQIIFPSNAPIYQLSSAPQSSKDAAKRDACLEACKQLHQLGALTHYLLPERDDENEDLESSSDSDCSDDEDTRRELHEMLVPAVLKEPWSEAEDSVHLRSYFVKFRPHPPDRDYRPFGLFVKASLPGDAERMKLDLHLARGRSVATELVPFRTLLFSRDQLALAEKFQEMFLKVIIDRSQFCSEFVPLGRINSDILAPRTYYLMLPVICYEFEEAMVVDWNLVMKCLSSPIFNMPEVAKANELPQPSEKLHLANGPKSVNDVVNSLIYVPSKKLFYFVSDVLSEKNAYSDYKASKSHVHHFSERFGVHLLHPKQALLKAKQLFSLENLLRKKGNLEPREKEEHFVELPPEICELKIIGFSKDVGSSLSLLPSVMHRLESLLVAVELKHLLSVSFPEGAEVSASRVLEALTTEKCNEHFSLERLEVLGDAFLKYAVGRRLFVLHDALDEGQLTRKRSSVVNNSNLLKLAIANRLQVYIRDQSFDPCQFFALGRPCSVVCKSETEKTIHSSQCSRAANLHMELRCTKSHHWLHKKTIADVVESLVGAFIVDSGFKGAAAFLNWMGIQVEFEGSKVSHICSASSIYLPLAAQIDIAALEDSIGYQFNNKGLLVQAFVHPSYTYHSGGCYQRLEFLGDAVLDYLITSYLYSVYPNLKPGQLTDLRSTCVNNISFANIAIRRSFYKYIISESSGLCKSMEKYVMFSRTHQLTGNLVEAPPCPKALGDIVESCIGAILLDTGFNLNHVWKTMLSFLDPVIHFSGLQLNPIRELQELSQSYNMELKFASSKKDNTYTVEIKVNGKDVCEHSSASNFSKKAAKRRAAKQLILILKEHGYKSKSKSLEEVLKLTHKMEAKLIGYNEAPTDVNDPYATIAYNEKTPTDVSAPFATIAYNEKTPTDVSAPFATIGYNEKTPTDVSAPFATIGNNETPTNVSTPYARGFDILKVQDSCTSGSSSSKVNPLGVQLHRSGGIKINPIMQKSSLCDTREYQTTDKKDSDNCSSDSQNPGRSVKKSAKSLLFEICAANGWKPPIFVCCKETGADHLKEFTFTVIVKPDSLEKCFIEAIGKPAGKKKEAAEHAAEGAVWLLRERYGVSKAKPGLSYFADAEGTVCQKVLPSDPPISQVLCDTQSSQEACKQLPEQDDATEDLKTSTDSNCLNDDNTRRELDKILVPTVLKEQWSNSEEVSSFRDARECQLIGKKDDSCCSGSVTPGHSMKKSATSILFEFCAANRWKPPLFVCCKETGASHLKEFTYKVIVKPDGLEKCLIEAIGKPAGKKKEAATHAAEGAVWLLREHFGVCMPNLELSSKVHPLGGEPYRSEGSKIKQTGQMSSFHETRECQQIVKQVDDCRSSDSQTAGCSMKKSSKSQLFEICAANRWKPPIFVCCKETGASHLKEFTYKVIVKPDSVEKCIIEAIGRPAGKKKEAAENAAKGAVWLLKDHLL
ncbi:dicer-like protein 4 isoform X3 [Daucus carota subsp. sativus]|uniref:dicer-like protein 4 isoform X3 n=1 Tax=Daucus carota subsp. sativus TaxID=79200 RepID=UPI0007EF8E66|nr:PREDICTED: dicer-like protein 4 isoform X3 [Daucus carota subsp. sativus]